jgi:hypothetical protein
MELISPTNKAIDSVSAATSGEKPKPRTTDTNPGALLSADAIPAQSPVARAQPSKPPANAIRVASPATMLKISPEEKPRVLSIPTSRVRSRTDIERALVEIKSMVNVTAPHMAARNSFKLPRNETKLNMNACSGSLFVG